MKECAGGPALYVKMPGEGRAAGEPFLIFKGKPRKVDTGTSFSPLQL